MAALKRLVTAIGDRIQDRVENCAGDEENRARLRKHLWRFAVEWWPRPDDAEQPTIEPERFEDMYLR